MSVLQTAHLPEAQSMRLVLSLLAHSPLALLCQQVWRKYPARLSQHDVKAGLSFFVL